MKWKEHLKSILRPAVMHVCWNVITHFRYLTWDINSECIETFLMGGSECCYGGQMTLKLIHEVLVLDVLKRYKLAGVQGAYNRKSV